MPRFAMRLPFSASPSAAACLSRRRSRRRPTRPWNWLLSARCAPTTRGVECRRRQQTYVPVRRRRGADAREPAGRERARRRFGATSRRR